MRFRLLDLELFSLYVEISEGLKIRKYFVMLSPNTERPFIYQLIKKWKDVFSLLQKENCCIQIEYFYSRSLCLDFFTFFVRSNDKTAEIIRSYRFFFKNMFRLFFLGFLDKFIYICVLKNFDLQSKIFLLYRIHRLTCILQKSLTIMMSLQTFLNK